MVQKHFFLRVARKYHSSRTKYAFGSCMPLRNISLVSNTGLIIVLFITAHEPFIRFSHGGGDCECIQDPICETSTSQRDFYHQMRVSAIPV